MNAEEIINAVAALTGVAVEEMITPGRQARKVFARTLAANEIRQSCVGYSLQDIGELFSMDHGNIAHSLTRHRNLMQTDPAYRRAASQLSEMNLNTHIKTE